MSRTPERVPHAFPFRLVEKAEPRGPGVVAVVLATAGGALTGITWPASLVAEALAQSILLCDPPADTAHLRLVAIDGFRLLQPVSAGDRLEVAVQQEAVFGALRRYECRALRSGALVAVARIAVSG